MLGPGPRLIKKNLPGRGLTKVEKHYPRPCHCRCSCITESQCLGANQCTAMRKCRKRLAASRHLKPDMAFYITCEWNLRCRPGSPPSLLYNGYGGYPRGKADAAWCWSPTSFQMPGCQWVRATAPPPLCACMGMSRGELYPHVETRFSLHLRNEFYNELPSISSSSDSF